MALLQSQGGQLDCRFFCSLLLQLQTAARMTDVDFTFACAEEIQRQEAYMVIEPLQVGRPSMINHAGAPQPDAPPSHTIPPPPPYQEEVIDYPGGDRFHAVESKDQIILLQSAKIDELQRRLVVEERRRVPDYLHLLERRVETAEQRLRYTTQKLSAHQGFYSQRAEAVHNARTIAQTSMRNRPSPEWSTYHPTNYKPATPTLTIPTPSQPRPETYFLNMPISKHELPMYSPVHTIPVDVAQPTIDIESFLLTEHHGAPLLQHAALPQQPSSYSFSTTRLAASSHILSRERELTRWAFTPAM